MNTQKNSLNAITIDVEEWHQTVLFENNNNKNDKITNLPKNISDILSLLDEYNTKATFFIVASLINKYPEIGRIIIQRGHEICSHGYLHRLVYKISKQEFYNDVRISLEILKQNTNSDILGYRAPTWSITKKAYWAIEILQSLGLKYDSSIYPISINISKCRNYIRFPYEIKKNFYEFPPSTFKFLGYNLPFAGGTFLRLFHPSFIIDKIIDMNKKGNPAMLYLHSWEFDENFPYQICSKWKRIIQCGNLISVKTKIRLLLESFKFCPIRDVLQLK